WTAHFPARPCALRCHAIVYPVVRTASDLWQSGRAAEWRAHSAGPRIAWQSKCGSSISMRTLRCRGGGKNGRQNLGNQLPGGAFDLLPGFRSLGRQGSVGGMYSFLCCQTGALQSAIAFGVPLLDTLLPSPENLRPGGAQLCLVFLKTKIRFRN